MAPRSRRPAFKVSGQEIAAGERRTIKIPVSVLSDNTPMSLPLHVVHGRRDGPVLFVSAAVHGDEIQGVEIIRRLLRRSITSRISGTLIAVPIVNAYGFISHSRYLPDRRDLNRSFPGSERGSLASRLANLFLNEVVMRSDLGIDLHSAAVHRSNLPQIRIARDNAKLYELAVAFGAPIVIQSTVRPGSLRATAADRGVDVMIYEAGEALRFDESAIRIGERGVLAVMNRIGMINAKKATIPRHPPAHSTNSNWVRAPEGGILRVHQKNGTAVKKGEVIGVISDPIGESETEVVAANAGIIIGRTNLPIVNEGDALFHIAEVAGTVAAGNKIEAIVDDLESNPMFDEDEII
jgi:predicted deacylase